MSDTLPGIAPVSITCSITPAAPVDRWTVEGVDFHGNIVREVYDVPRGERVVTNMREVRTIHMETVEPGKVTVSNPDRAQIALLGALAADQVKTEQVKRDPDPTAPGAPGERVERRG